MKDPQCCGHPCGVQSNSSNDSFENPRARTWRVGYSFRRLFWENFASLEEADIRYHGLWWSKVLLDPDGKLLKCSTSMADPKGIGVAKLLLQVRPEHREEGPPTAQNSLDAIDEGKVPFVPADLLPAAQHAWRFIWNALSFRDLIKWWSPSSCLCYFDLNDHPGVRSHVALTIDDVPCRLGAENSMLPEVRQLLKKYGAKASFMLIGSFVPGNEDQLVSLLEDGHEFGNHGFVDKSYARSSPIEFEAAIDQCSDHITKLQQRAGKLQQIQWFRPPYGKLSPVMSEVFKQKNMTSVMGDVYAWCAQIQDGEFIGNFLGSNVDHGSIIILHMPEHGFREWCYVALEVLLKRLQERELTPISLGALAELAEWRGT